MFHFTTHVEYMYMLYIPDDTQSQSYGLPEHS